MKKELKPALFFGAITLFFLGTVAAAFMSFETGSQALEALPAIDLPLRQQQILHLDNQPVRLSAIASGYVSIKSCHAIGCLPEIFPYPIRFLAIVTDRRVGKRLPIWSYVIEHPEGVFVVDAGASAKFNDPETWISAPQEGAIMRGFLRIDSVREAELPYALQDIGIGPENVGAVILTHQHIDHTASVPRFANAEVWTTSAEDQAARFIGAMQFRWRSNTTRIRYVDVEANKNNNPDNGKQQFPSVNLTKDGRLIAYHTAGHTPGSVTVLLRADEGHIWFIGDTSFRASDLGPSKPTTGMHFNVAAARRVQLWLKSSDSPRVFLTSHEDELGQFKLVQP